MSRQEYVEKVQAMLHDPITDDVADSFVTYHAAMLGRASSIGLPRKSVNLPSWQYLNEYIKGFCPNEFSILCGPTGSGKTTLLASWAVELASTNVPTYMAAVEVGSNEFMGKMMGALIGKDLHTLTEDQREAVTKECKPILGTSASVLANYDSRVSHLNILADLLYCVEKKGTQVAFIDNLNFMMEVRKATDQLLEMDRVIHDFVIFCKKVPIHVVMVMHPKKTDGGRVVSEFDIKGSSTAVQESANVLLLNRLENDKSAGMYNPRLCREITIAKSRFNGRHVGKKIILAIHSQSELLKEIAHG